MVLNLRHSHLTKGLFMTGKCDHGETSLLKRLLQPGTHFADVGANVGYYTLLAASLVGPAGRVYAFEPDPACYDLLRRSVEINHYRHVVVLQKALAALPGEVWLSQPQSKTNQQLLRKPRSGARRYIAVEATTLDAAIEREGGRLDVVKIDVEGAEEGVLQGMQVTLARNPHIRFLIEFNPRALAESGTDPSEHLLGLEGSGFRFCTITADGHTIPVDARQIVASCRPGEWVNLFCERSSG